MSRIIAVTPTDQSNDKRLRSFAAVSELSSAFKMDGDQFNLNLSCFKSALARHDDKQAVPLNDEEALAERAQLVLIAMYELGAFDSDDRTPAAEITAKAFGKAADANSVKHLMVELKTHGLIESKKGKGGGYWLTNRGQARAQKLCQL